MDSIMSQHHLSAFRVLDRVKAYLNQKFARSDGVRIHLPPHLKGRLSLCRVDEDLALNLELGAAREHGSDGGSDT
jgi:hypothetical protein